MKGYKKKDTVLKEFFRNNERFADFFNTVVFHGKQVLKPDELEEKDTDVSSVIKNNSYLESIARSRDVIKKSTHGVDFIMLGVENQMMVHYAMPLRTMVYDDLTYLKECNSIIAKNRKEKRTEDRAEYLSGFKKTDKLHAVITVVVYYGKEPWDGPMTLSDMINFDGLPPEVMQCFSDYKMNLFQMIDSGKVQFQNYELNVVFHASALLLKKEFEQLKKDMGQMRLDQEVKTVIGVITGSEEKIENYLGQMEGEEDMRTWVDDLQDIGREEGGYKKLFSLLCKKLKKGKTPECIAEELEEEVDTVQTMCDIAQKYAPDYDIDKIYEDWKTINSL